LRRKKEKPQYRLPAKRISAREGGRRGSQPLMGKRKVRETATDRAALEKFRLRRQRIAKEGEPKGRVDLVRWRAREKEGN